MDGEMGHISFTAGLAWLGEYATWQMVSNSLLSVEQVHTLISENLERLWIDKKEGTWTTGVPCRQHITYFCTF